MGRRVPMVAAVVVVFVTCAIWGFRSYRECGGEAGEDAAFAGSAGETSIANLTPLAAVVLKTDAEGTAIAAVRLMMRMACSTWTAGSGLVAGRRLACRAGHAVVIGQMLASLTVGCGKRLGESPICSWLRPP